MRVTSARLTNGSYPLQHSAQPGGQAMFSGMFFQVRARQVDDFRDRFDELGIVVVFVDPFALVISFAL